MFKKDEYNQEEYNDYYQQEVAGAELNGSGEGKEKGGMGKLMAVPLLIILAVAGYFGYNMMNSQPEEIDTTLQVSMDNLPQSVQGNEEPTQAIEPTETTEPISSVAPAENQITDLEKELERAMGKTVEAEESTIEEEPTIQKPKEIVTELPKEVEGNTIQTAVTQEVQKAVSTSGKMSPEEVASIVAAVMQQMNQSKNSDTSTAAPIADKKDVELMNDLSDSDVDSVSADLIKELENINLSENTEIDTSSKKQINVYNKVNVQRVTGNDTLSQLSNEINNVISEGINENKAKTYTESLKSEVDVRQNEMRIIVVKKGDTLGKLAQRAYGNVMDYKRIYRANPELTRPDRIYIGQKLRIPN